MSRRDLVHRLASLAALLGAGAAYLLHRGIWLPGASGGEALFGFFAFTLAGYGTQLVIRGAKLRDRWIRDHERAASERRSRTGGRTSGALPRARWIEKAESDPAIFACGRATLAAFLVLRARQAAADAKPSSRHEPSTSS